MMMQRYDNRRQRRHYDAHRDRSFFVDNLNDVAVVVLVSQ